MPKPTAHEQINPGGRGLRVSHIRIALLAIALAGFSARAARRISLGPADFWSNGYSSYFEIAQNLASGRGFCIDRDGWECAYTTPIYPLFLAALTGGRGNWLPIVLAQAAIGSGVALCAYFIGKELFGCAAGLVAGAIAALYPYYVMHDTALQETSLLTFLTAVCVLFLIRGARRGSKRDCALAGLLLGAAVLTKASLAPFSALALLWIAFFGSGAPAQRLKRLSVIALCFALMVIPWLIRTYLRVGAPVLTSQTGRLLWVANNPDTFSHFPRESMDLSEQQAWMALTPAELEQLRELSGHEIARSHWFQSRALQFIREHPRLTVTRAIRKVGAAFSWTSSPAKEPFAQIVYSLSYVPIAVLGIAGMLLARRQWREHGVIYMLFLAFVIVTAVFWAHTSQRSYLDLFWIVFAAHALTTIYSRRPVAWRSMSTLPPTRSTNVLGFFSPHST